MKKIDVIIVIIFIGLLFSVPIYVGKIGIITWGYWTGIISQYTFLISLLPGIHLRFDMTYGKRLYIFIRKYRRTIGITAYTAGVLHFYWSFILPNRGQFFPDLLSDWMGFVALLLLTPLFLTSNDLSLNKLGKLWKKLHLVVHLVIYLLLMHVVIKGRLTTSLVTGFVMVADVFSWVVLLMRDRREIKV